jgi:hypothetical protein
MRCTRVEKLLPLHVAGDLDGRRARAVANHLATCEACRRTASDYDASRDLLRAATLPPDFDGAFYEEIRSSVLDRIRRDRTLAPPPSSIFASLFNARFAYAASLAFVIIAATLALYSYTRRTSDDGARDKMIAGANRADVNRERDAQPTATTETARAARGSEPQTSSTMKEAVKETIDEGSRLASKSSPRGQRSLRNGAQDGERPSFALTRHTPSGVKRNPLAPSVARTIRPKKEELAARSETTAEAAQPEVSRIEIQTSDPNIRIIWLASKAEAAEPLR